MGVKTPTVRMTRHRHITKTARQAGVDPYRPVAIFWSTGRYTLQAAVYRNRREDQNSVNAAVGGFLPACEQIATDRPLSKMRRCANDPKRPFARPDASCLVEDVECGQATRSRQAVPQIDREPRVAGP